MIDLGPTRIIVSREDAPWAVAADAALLVAAAEIGLTYGAGWAIPVLAGVIYLLIGQASVFRYRVMSVAAELRAGFGLLAFATPLWALIEPAPCLSIAVCGAVGAAKLARECLLYAQLKLAMLAEGKIRRINRRRLAVFSGLAGGALAVIVLHSGEVPSLAVAYAAWAVGYFAVSAAVEVLG